MEFQRHASLRAGVGDTVKCFLRDGVGRSVGTGPFAAIVTRVHEPPEPPSPAAAFEDPPPKMSWPRFDLTVFPPGGASFELEKVPYREEAIESFADSFWQCR